MRSVPRRAVVGSMVVLVVGWLLPLAGLQSGAAADDESVPTVDDGRLLMVLDSSGSMRERASGVAKIASAKRALHAVVDGLDPAAEVGLRVYGAKVFSRDDAGACTDSQLAVPVASGNAGDLHAAIDRYRPYGETPIGYALRQAADDLGDDGQRSILLVSDGEATCPPDPCRVATDLARRGIDVRIDVVGLAVSGAARSQLQCIAAEGKGSYYDADSADELVATLDRLSTRAFRPFGIAGTPVTGTPTPAEAPGLAPGAAYSDVLPGADETRHYLVQRTIPGSTLRVRLAARPDVDTGQMRLELLDSGENTCAVGVQTAFGIGFGVQLLTGSVTSDDDCPADGPVVARLQKSVFGEDLDGEPVQLVVSEEPPVDRVDSLPAPAEAAEAIDPWREGPAADGPTPGVSFNDAPLLEAGSHRQSLVPGEVQFYRVPVDWGQRLHAQIRMARPGPALADAIGLVRPVDVLVYGPSYDQVATGGRTIVNTSGPTSRAVSTPEVRYRNREALTIARGASEAGDYYVGVSLSGDSSGREGEAFLVPYTLTVRTVGEPSGAPTYLADGVSGSGSAAPSPAPSAAATPTEDARAVDPPADEGSGVLLWVVVGAIVLTGGGLLAGRLLRR